MEKGKVSYGFYKPHPLAALMSTTDSVILALAAAISYDIYGNVKPNTTERQLVRLSAILVVVFGAVTFFAAIYPPKFLTALLKNILCLPDPLCFDGGYRDGGCAG